MTDDTTDAVDRRIDGLEAALTRRFETIHERIDELEQENEELRQENGELRHEIEQLHGELTEAKRECQRLQDQAAIFDPNQRDSMTKREVCERALRSALWNRAQTNDGKSQMTYREVRNALVDKGVENVHAPECYRAMEDVAYTDGFEETSNMENQKVIRLNLDDTPIEMGGTVSDRDVSEAVNASGGVNRINNGNNGSGSRSDGNNGGENNQG